MNGNSLPIPMTEVAALLRRVIRGEANMVSLVDGLAWHEAYSGNYDFEVDGWKLTFFNDCGELDYVDRAESPDGRAEDLESWREVGEGITEVYWCPLELLTDQELCQLEQLMDAIPAAKPTLALLAPPQG